jgi:Na+/proline symporter
MISASGLVTENLYRPLFPNRSETHYLWVARVSGLAVVVIAIVYAFWLSGVIQGLELLWKLNAVMAPAFWLGVFWRRATTAGAWAATVLTAGTWWITNLSATANVLADWPLMKSMGIVVSRGDEFAVSTPWQMLAYLSAGFAGGILISLWTRKPESEKLERFYELMRTPIQPNEVIETPCTLPVGVVAAPRRVFLPNSSLEIPIPTWRAVSGFTVGWLLVFAIIGGVWLMIASA